MGSKSASAFFVQPVGRVRRSRNPPHLSSRKGGGLRFANPPYTLLRQLPARGLIESRQLLRKQCS